MYVKYGRQYTQDVQSDIHDVCFHYITSISRLLSVLHRQPTPTLSPCYSYLHMMEAVNRLSDTEKREQKGMLGSARKTEGFRSYVRQGIRERIILNVSKIELHGVV